MMPITTSHASSEGRDATTCTDFTSFGYQTPTLSVLSTRMTCLPRISARNISKEQGVGIFCKELKILINIALRTIVHTNHLRGSRDVINHELRPVPGSKDQCLALAACSVLPGLGLRSWNPAWGGPIPKAGFLAAMGSPSSRLGSSCRGRNRGRGRHLRMQHARRRN